MKVIHYMMPKLLCTVVLTLLPIIVAAQDPSFTVIDATLPGLKAGDAVWGDYDVDGDLDLLVCGSDTNNSAQAYLFKNTNANFTLVPTALPGVSECNVDWADYDNDGDLDIFINGNVSGGIGIPENGATLVSKIFRNDSGTFVDINAEMIGVASGDSGWGDVDGDGDIDAIVVGHRSFIDTELRVYLNNGGFFNTYIEFGRESLNGERGAIAFGSNDWADYDYDGDLDFLTTGLDPEVFKADITSVHTNNGSSFDEQSNFSLNINGVYGGSAKWGDFDNDGDFDVLLTGTDNLTFSDPISQIFSYDPGTNSYTEVNAGLQASRAQVSWADVDNDGRLDAILGSNIYLNEGSSFSKISTDIDGVSGAFMAWGDIDSDGDLDLYISGGSTPAASVYRNDSQVANQNPLPPQNIASIVNGDAVTLTWGAGGDLETPAEGLTYNIRVGTSLGAENIISAMASSSGKRRVVGFGNAYQARSRTFNGLEDGMYFWSVQSIDSKFSGSTFASGGFEIGNSSGQIAGTLYDLRLTDLGNVLENVFAGATVNLLRGGILVATTQTDASGEFFFGDVELGDLYTLVFEAKSTVSITEEVLSLKATVDGVNVGSSASYRLPATLSAQKKELIYKLENLQIDSGLLFGNAPPFALRTSYEEFGAEVLLESWFQNYAANEWQVESLVRMAIAERALASLFQQGAALSHDTGVVVYEVGKSFVGAVLLIRHIGEYLRAVKIIPKFVIEGLQSTMLQLATELIIDAAIEKGRALGLSDEEATLFKDALNGANAAFFSNSGKGFVDFIATALDDQFKNAVATGVDQIVMSNFVNKTQSDLDQVISNAAIGDFSDSRSEAITAVNQRLSDSNLDTQLALIESERLQTNGNAGSTLSQFSALAGSLTGGVNPFSALAAVIAGFTAGQYGKAIYTSASQLFDVQNEDIPFALNTAFSPNAAMAEAKPVGVAEADINIKQRNQIGIHIDEYMAFVGEISEALALGEYENAIVLLERLELVDGRFRRELASLEDAFFSIDKQTSDTLPGFVSNLNQLADQSTAISANRLLFYGEVVQVIIDQQTGDSFQRSVETLGKSLDEYLETVNELSELIGNVDLQARAAVVAHNVIRIDSLNQEVFDIEAIVINSGSLVAEEVVLELDVDPVADIIADSLMYIDALEVGAEATIRWRLQLNASQSVGSYTIKLNGTNISESTVQGVIDRYALVPITQCPFGLSINAYDTGVSGGNESLQLNNSNAELISLTGCSLVFIDGSSSEVYFHEEINGLMDPSSVFLIGNGSVEGVNYQIPLNSIRDEAGALALFKTDASRISVGMTPEVDGLIYAIVFTADSDILGEVFPENREALTEFLQELAAIDTGLQEPSPKFSFHLDQNYPNPATGATRISFSIPSTQKVVLTVYDALGREIITLLQKELSVGHHSVTLDAGDLSQGVYFYRLTGSTRSQIKRLVVLNRE